MLKGNRYCVLYRHLAAAVIAAVIDAATWSDAIGDAMWWLKGNEQF